MTALYREERICIRHFYVERSSHLQAYSLLFTPDDGAGTIHKCETPFPLASIMTLEPGDVIATGTPARVGYGKHPPEYLRSGDRMVVEIEGLGQLETPVT